VIADHLTRQGIAVLRRDDRGVGGSTGKTSQSTSEEFAGDVLADIAYLKTRSDIDSKKIGLLGHSEGAIVAPMVASRSSDVSFIVLLSGPAISGEQTLLLQGERLLKARGANAEVLARQAQSQRLFFDVARGKVSAEEATARVTADVGQQVASLPEARRQAATELARKQLDAQIADVRTPWFRFFLDYDPAPALAKVRCPVLALFGELDLQVPVDPNKAAMEQVFAKSANRDTTVKVLPKANHLYQEAKTGDFGEYAMLKKEFVPELLPTVTTWIRQHGGL
jgi:pimeloyl-ACP methyl ester carboxylesterase